MIDFGEHRPRRKYLDLTPMIDVVFLLLIFFMLTSIFGRPLLPMELPGSQSGVVAEESPVSITLLRDGSLYLNNQPMALSALQASLKQIFESRLERNLSLRADEGVPFGEVVRVMDEAKLGGAENISVVTEAR